MEIDLSEHKRFVYRHAPGLRAFGIAGGFVYSVTSGGIVQTERRTARFLAHSAVLPAVKTIVHENLLFIAASDSLFYFDGEARLIGSCPALSASFAIPGFICTIGDDVLMVFDAAKRSVAGEARINGPVGLCSAVLVGRSSVFLGYETGKVYAIPIAGIHERSLRPEIVCDLGEPILSMAMKDDAIYIALLSSKLVRLRVGTAGFKYTNVPTPLKKIVAYGDHLVCFEGSRVMILDLELKIVAFHLSDVPVVDLAIADGAMHIGYSSSLIVEYDMAGIARGIRNAEQTC